MKKNKSMDWWSPCISPPILGQNKKPRTRRITMAIDKGMGLFSVDDLLESAGEYIDIIKMTAGTAPLCHQDFIREKIRRFQDRDVDVMLGGTLTEIAINQGTYPEYLEFLSGLDCNAVEIADGSIVLPREQRREAVKQALDMGFRVITEVGKEDPAEALSLEETASMVAWDAESGANLINIEAREFGNVGIYQNDGSVQEDLLQAIHKALQDPNRLLWEAPLFGQQVELVRRLGSEVNLANIQPTDVLRLETIRRGLIGDTFRDTLRNPRNSDHKTR